MKDSRREFIKKSASVAAGLSIAGINSPIPDPAEKKKKAASKPAIREGCRYKICVPDGSDFT
jgi:hypothetical protein